MSKTVFAFGRMNPPTVGHEKLAAKVESEARRRGAMPHIYLSHTQNATKDPLPYNVKIAIAKKAFGKAVTTSSAKTIIQVMQELENMGHTEVTLVAGSDRVPEFKTFLAKYNGKDYNFKKIEVVSAGERDPDAEGVAGMSASKLRAIAKEGDYNTFAQGMPSKLTDRDKKKVYNAIRSVMEDINEAPRIARKKGQPAGSDKHSDLYTDENPKGTIHGLKFATEKDAEASVAKIKSSGKKHAHKIQAAIAMEQRARVAGKKAAAAVYRSYINDMKKKTKEMNEAFELKLERDKRAKLLVLHVKDTKTGNRSEVRGKPGYEIDGYDPKDKLHKVLDKIGKSANMSELMNGEKVTINPNHPKGKEAIKVAKEITTEMYEEVTAKQISDLEKFGDRLLDKFGVDIEFSKHFADRMNDDRNNPEIKVAEIQALFKKIARKKAVNIKKYKDSEVVLKDIQKDLNLPVAIKTGKDGELDVVHKTIMRKKNFKTPNPVVQYEETKLDEGVNDPAIFKAVFLAGGPGSGKSFIVGKTGLVNIGMKLVNSDDEFERRLKKAGLDAGNPDDIYSPQGQALRGKAKKTTANKQDMYIKGRLGLVLDGTGKDYNKIKKVRDQLIRIGYDTAMIFVNTNLETSLERNRKRARSLPDNEVEKMWQGVQDNMGKFQNLFGSDFTIVDNSEGADTPSATTSAYKKMVKFAKQSPKTRAAKNWIANEKSRRGIKEDYDPTDEELDDILTEIEDDDDLFWEWDEDRLDIDEARKPLTLQQRMKKRILMRRLAPIIARKRKIRLRRRANRGQLMKRSRRAAILLLKKRFAGSKGKNYRALSPSEKIGIDKLVQKKLPMVDRIAKRLLPKMLKKETERMRRKTSGVNEEFELFIERKVAQDPDVDERPGTQPKKYYSGVSKKSKEARARHFERGAKMDDDNPAAYTPAPGDAKGKTKPSKHTKKFKQMYGEEKPCWDGYKQVGMKKGSSGKMVPNCVPEEVKIDEGKVKFVKDKQFSNLRKPKKTTDFEFKKLLMKTKSRQRDYFKDEDVNESALLDTKVIKTLPAPKRGGEVIIRKHNKENKFFVRLKYTGKSAKGSRPENLGTFSSLNDAMKAVKKKGISVAEAVSRAQQAAIAIAKKKSGKYDDDGKKIDEQDAVANAKERHNDEKERLKRKHDRELDAARLRDTRTKNANEAFEALINQSCCDDCNEDEYGWTEETNFTAIDEGAAEYQGRKVKLNNPTRSDNPKKKTMVYVKNDKGNVVKVYFGDPNLSIKRDDPERRKSFRARHNCDNPGPKWKARYWSCKFWSSKKVSDLMKG